jgi:hypothetical protein
MKVDQLQSAWRVVTMGHMVLSAAILKSLQRSDSATHSIQQSKNNKKLQIIMCKRRPLLLCTVPLFLQLVGN